MVSIEIKDVEAESIDDLVRLYVPPIRMNDPLFVGGMSEERRWANSALQEYGSIALIAYADSKPAGRIQYQPRPSEGILEITCIFVPEKENLRRGLGTSLRQPNPFQLFHLVEILVLGVDDKDTTVRG